MHHNHGRRIDRALRSVAAALPFLLWTAATTARAGDVPPADRPAYQVADINTAPDPLASAQAADFVEIGDLILFSAYDIEHGRELWRTDRTPEGTQLVKDIAPGAAGSDPVVVHSAAGVVLFAAFEPEADLRLWRSDGTAAGTVEVADLPDDFPYALAGGFFTIRNEIWAADDLARGAVKVTDLPDCPWGVVGEGARRFVWIGGQLWKTDGTAAGTSLLGDFERIVEAFIGEQGPLWFFSRGAEGGVELRTSDGTPAGTKLVLDLPAPDGAGCPCWKHDEPILFGDTLLFFLLDYTEDEGAIRLWRSDGTTAGTSQIAAFSSSDVEIAMFEFDGAVFFPAGDEVTGVELWRTDGTPEGTRLVADVNPGPGTSFAPFERSPDFASAGGQLYFLADDGTHGRELWRTDGTEGGTSIVRDLNPGPDGAFFWHDDADDFIPRFTAVGDWLVFIASDGASGHEFWRTDGTAGGTVRLADAAPGEADVFGCWREPPDSICTPSSPILLPFGANDDTIVFGTAEPGAGFTLWRGDLPTGESARIATLGVGASVPWRAPSRRDGSILVVYDEVTGSEPWWTDGTSEGTYLLRDFARGNRGSRPHSITAIDDVVLFFADDGVHGEELWRSDGSEEGTSLVADIRLGPDGSTPQEPRELGPTIVFAADDGVHGQEIWRTDGTAGGTFLLRDVRDGPEPSSPRPFARLDDVLLFSASDGVHGYELWRTDGTVAGTHLVVDIEPGAGDGVANVISARLGQTLLFTGYRSSSGGYDVWRTDGTAAGTQPLGLLDLVGNPEFPYDFAASGDFAYFAANLALWRTDGTADGTRAILGISSVAELESDGDALFATAYSREGGKLFKIDAGSEQGQFLGRVDTYGFVAAGGSAFATKTDAQQIVRDAWYELTPAQAGTWFWGLRIVRDRLVFLQSTGSDQDLTLWSSDGTAAGTRPLQALPMAPPYLYEGTDFEIVAAGDLAFFPHTGPAGRELWTLPLAALPEVCRDCIPTPTPRPTATPRPTRTPACPRDGAPSCPALRVSDAAGEPGDTVAVTVALATSGRDIPAVQNDLSFDPLTPVAATTDGKPDCWVNPSIGKGDTAFAFHPRGCQPRGVSANKPGADCNRIRAGVFAFGDTEPIPDGVLYTCRVEVSAGAAPGSYPLVLSKALSFDPTWQEIAMLTADGAVTVSEATREGSIGSTRGGEAGGGCQVSRRDSGRTWWTVLIFVSAVLRRRRRWIGRSMGVAAALSAISAGRLVADGPAHLVKDINTLPDSVSSDAADFIDLGGLIFFTALDYEHGRELWRTDRTPGGTVLVADIAPGPRGSDPIVIDAVDGVLIFAAYDEGRNLELWHTDGSEGGTRPFVGVTDGTPGATRTAFRLREPYRLAGDLLASGGQLWRIDTSRFELILLGEFGRIRWTSVDRNGVLFFFVEDDDYSVSLWRSDGTQGGTAMVSDLGMDRRGDVLRAGGPQPHFLGSSLLFFLENYMGETGAYELWRSDGTAAGTRLLGQFVGSSFYYEMVDAAGAVFFVGNDGGPAGPELWKTDGTPEGTAMVADVRPGLVSALAGFEYGLHFAVANDILYFLADDGVHGVELWRSDGTASGTSLVVDLYPGPASAFLFYDDLDRYLPEFITFDDVLLFVANDGIYGHELWRTDGSAAGTIRLSDAAPGPADLFDCWDAQVVSDCHPAYPTFARIGDDRREVLFTAPAGEGGAALWRSDLTPSGTRQVTVVDPGWLSLAIATVDGEGAIVLASKDSIGTEPWWTDGTQEGTFLLRDIARGGIGSNPRNLTPLGDSIFFAADDGVRGMELWRSDGTFEGTTLVADIFPGDQGSFPHNVRAFEGALLFTAFDGIRGTELWRSDGTAEGTSIVRDIHPGPDSSEPRPLGSVDGALLIAADDGVHGSELWRTDGTEEGTAIVADTNPGPGSGLEDGDTEGASLDGAVLFPAYRSDLESVLWRSDGTAEGTWPLRSANVGGPNHPSQMTRFDDLVFFTSDFTGGLWQTDGTPQGTKLVKHLIRVVRMEVADGALFLAAVDSRNVGQVFRFTPASMELRRLGEVDPWLGFATAGGSAFNVSSWPGSVLLRDGWYPLASASEEGVIEPYGARDSLLFFTRDFVTNEVALWSSDGTQAGTSPLQALPPAAPSFYEVTASEAAVAGDRVFVSLLGGALGRELWAVPLAALPEVCRDCVSLPTPTPTRTPQPTRTSTPSPTPACIAEVNCPWLRIEGAVGGPRAVVFVTVDLESPGRAIAAVQNDLAFELDAPIAARSDGSPDCTVNPEIGKRDTAFVFHPIGCTPAEDCTKIRAGVFAFGDTKPIPDGVLYTCRVTIAAGAASGTYPLPISNPLGFDASWVEIPMIAEHGAVIVPDPSLERPIRLAGPESDGCQVSRPASGSGWWIAFVLLPLLLRVRCARRRTKHDSEKVKHDLGSEVERDLRARSGRRAQRA